MESGLGLGELFRAHVGAFFTQLSLPGGLPGKEVAGLGQRLVFRTAPQPELRAEQVRDHFGLKSCRLFRIGLGDEHRGFRHLGIGTRAEQSINHAGQVEGHQSVRAGALLVARCGGKQAGRFFGKTGLRLGQVLIACRVRFTPDEGLQPQGSLGLAGGVQFARHDVRGFRETELKNYQTKFACRAVDHGDRGRRVPVVASPVGDRSQLP